MTTTEYKIATERLLLRPWLDGDAATLHRDVLGDPRVMEFATGVLSLEEVDEWIERKRRMEAERGFSHWAVEHDGRLIGLCGLAVQELPEGSFLEVGYRLAYAAWGRGFATEAAAQCVRWAWENTDNDRVTAIIEPANVRSVRVAEKLGMNIGWRSEFHGRVVDVYAVDRPAVSLEGAR